MWHPGISVNDVSSAALLCVQQLRKEISELKEEKNRTDEKEEMVSV